MDRLLDKRYSIQQEWCGHQNQRWVIRFCGEWVSEHPTQSEAVEVARKWELERREALGILGN